MKHWIQLLFLLIIVVHAEIQEGYINKFTMEDFESALEKKATIVVFVKNVNCLTCESDRWTVAKLNYNFMLRKNFYIFEEEAGDIPEFDKEFEIKDDFEHPQFLLFKEGSRTPARHESAEDIADWVTRVTLVEHFPDEVIELTEDTYFSYPKKNPKRNVLVMFYAPKFEHTHLVVMNYYRNAFAFKNEYKIVFARFNCENKISFCKSLELENVLEFRFIPAKDTEYDGEILRSLRGERIADFVNRHIGTNISGMGGMNERFGRVKELDLLAHRFMETKDAEIRSQIIKDTVKLRKRYKNTGKYYTFMKLIQKEGVEAFKKEKESLAAQLKELKTWEGHEYEVLRSKQNIAEMFRNIKMKNRLVGVTLDPYSFDYVVNGDRNVMLMVTTQSCTKCNIMKIIYTNAAKKGLQGVVFGILDGDAHFDFAANFGVEPNDPIIWFTRGTPTNSPIVADVKSDVDSIFRFARDHMVDVDDVEIRNEEGGEEEEL